MLALTITSQKGGVGKTTVALNLGFALARRGWRTLLVDADPAGAIGLSLTRKVADAPGLAELARDGGPAADRVIETRLKGLGILPVGHVPASEAGGFQARLADGAVLGQLAVELRGRYDLAVIDTPAGFGDATLGALRASAWALSPVQAEPIAARQATRVFEVVEALRARGARLELLGVVLTMLQARDASSMAVAEDLLRALPARSVLETTIPRDAAFLEASAAGVPVGLLKRRTPAVAAVFDRLAEEVEGRSRLASENADGPIALVD